MDSLEQLVEDLRARWRQQFGRVSGVYSAAERGKRVIYARAPLFDLKNFTPSKLPAGGRVLDEPVPGCDHYIYRLDARGRPVHMSHRHSHNGFDWEGAYRYAPEEVEYVEYCLQTEVPSQYTLVTLRDGHLASFQRMVVNGAGSYSRDADQVESDLRNYLIWVEQYDAIDGRIESGRSYSFGFGSHSQRSTLSYSYGAGGKLERIVRTYEDGSRQTVFAARSKTSMKELSTRLSHKIAERAMEALREAPLDSPLVTVILSYRRADDYVPLILPCTERDLLADPRFPVSFAFDRAIRLNHEDFEPSMSEFKRRFFDTDRFSLGSKMLREAARLITTLECGSVATAENFVALAIDWELEGDDQVRILKECGASRECLKMWKSRGWIL